MHTHSRVPNVLACIEPLLSAHHSLVDELTCFILNDVGETTGKKAPASQRERIAFIMVASHLETKQILC